MIIVYSFSYESYCFFPSMPLTRKIILTTHISNQYPDSIHKNITIINSFYSFITSVDKMEKDSISNYI